MGCSEKIRFLFGSVAYHIASHPWKVCIVSFLLNGLLGLGMLKLPGKNLVNNDSEEVYMPRDPPTLSTQQDILKVFPDHSGTAFYTHQAVKQPIYGELIIWRREKQNLINDTLYDDLQFLISDIKNISVISIRGNTVNYLDVCARRNGKCVTNGEKIIEQLLDCKDGLLPLAKLQSENDTILENPLFQLADFIVVNNSLMSATYLKVRFNLRQDNSEFRQDAKLWTDKFISHMKLTADQWYTRGFYFTFSHQMSYLEELGNDTYTDIPYFSFVFTIYFFYLAFVMSGGNILTKRAHIGRMGIMVSVTSILGAWGLLMACEVEFTNAIGIAPMFILEHQIINTMITLSHLSDVNDETDARKRVEYAIKMSAIPVTTTTLCHVVPFTVAIFSKYYVMELVGLYVVTTMLFNYVNHFVFYTSCLAIHEHRINAGRHCCVCTALRPREELEGRHCCIVCCCSGNRPESRTDTDSSIEVFSRKAMLRFLLTSTARYVSLVSYLALVAFAIWGLVCYRVDTLQENEVLSSSYFYDFNQKMRNEFEKESVIQFVTVHPEGYLSDQAIISDFQHKLKSNSLLQPHLLLTWKYLYDKSTFANYTTELAFYDSVKHMFLPSKMAFSNDICFNENNSIISATRFYIKSKIIPSTKSMISLKKGLFDLLDDANEHLASKHGETDKRFIFVHSPDFLPTDDWLSPLWEFLRFFGAQLGLLLVSLFIIKPCWSSLIFIPLIYCSMTTSLFGISHFLGIYLTQISMTMYMMAGSFFVEVIVHIYYSYFQASGVNSGARVNVVLCTASQSLFHAAFGQFLGLLVLIIVKSYVFVTVFRITLLTTGICIVFSLLWIPTSLSVLGPQSNDTRSDILEIYTKDTLPTTFVESSNEEIIGAENPSFF